MNDASIALIATGALTFLGTVFTGVVASRTSLKLAALAKVANTTHALVNSAMGVQLSMHEELTKRMAAKTGDPDDIAAAEEARRVHDEHKARQVIADSKSTPP